MNVGRRAVISLFLLAKLTAVSLAGDIGVMHLKTVFSVIKLFCCKIVSKGCAFCRRRQENDKIRI